MAESIRPGTAVSLASDRTPKKESSQDNLTTQDVSGVVDATSTSNSNYIRCPQLKFLISWPVIPELFQKFWQLRLIQRTWNNRHGNEGNGERGK
jgi:hypothetical protein